MLPRRRLLGLGLGALAGACVRGSRTTTPEPVHRGPVDRIVLGRVLTLDPERPEAEAIGIAGGRIVLVGGRAEVMERRGPSTEIVDIGTGLVTPGLVDAHAHLLGLGRSLEEVDLRGARSIEEVVQRVRAGDRGQAWLTGRGWDQNLWPGQAMPTHQPLSEAFGERPVWLRRVDGHAGWANAAAMRASGIARGQADPEGGEILRDADGEPTGVLVDAAMGLVQPPAATLADLRRQLAAAQAHVLALGLTGVHDMGVGPEIDALYREGMAAEDPAERLRLRVVGYADASWLLTFEREAERPKPDRRYALVGVKLYADGALGSRGAALLEPYHDRPDHRGLMQQNDSDLWAQCEIATRKGLQLATHAIGDAAIRAVLEAYATSVFVAKGIHEGRPRIEHAQIVDLADIPHFAELGVIASMQPTHATSDMAWVPDRLGPQRLAGAYAWRRFIDAGVPLAFGSDFPVELPNVTHGIYAAVTRQDAQGQPPGGWLPDQRLTLPEAITAFSKGAAYACFSEAFLGRISPGFQADLTCFRDDLRELTPATLRDAEVAATVVAGEVLHRA
jgi:predicted amidohydrolase YtcJ